MTNSTRWVVQLAIALLLAFQVTAPASADERRNVLIIIDVSDSITDGEREHLYRTGSLDYVKMYLNGQHNVNVLFFDAGFYIIDTNGVRAELKMSAPKPGEQTFKPDEITKAVRFAKNLAATDEKHQFRSPSNYSTMLDSIDFGGTTDISNALWIGYHFLRDKPNPVLLFFTDGEETIVDRRPIIPEKGVPFSDWEEVAKFVGSKLSLEAKGAYGGRFQRYKWVRDPPPRDGARWEEDAVISRVSPRTPETLLGPTTAAPRLIIPFDADDFRAGAASLDLESPRLAVSWKRSQTKARPESCRVVVEISPAVLRMVSGKLREDPAFRFASRKPAEQVISVRGASGSVDVQSPLSGQFTGIRDLRMARELEQRTPYEASQIFANVRYRIVETSPSDARISLGVGKGGQESDWIVAPVHFRENPVFDVSRDRISATDLLIGETPTTEFGLDLTWNPPLDGKRVDVLIRSPHPSALVEFRLEGGRLPQDYIVLEPAADGARRIKAEVWCGAREPMSPVDGRIDFSVTDWRKEGLDVRISAERGSIEVTPEDRLDREILNPGESVELVLDIVPRNRNGCDKTVVLEVGQGSDLELACPPDLSGGLRAEPRGDGWAFPTASSEGEARQATLTFRAKEELLQVAAKAEDGTSVKGNLQLLIRLEHPRDVADLVVQSGRPGRQGVFQDEVVVKPAAMMLVLKTTAGPRQLQWLDFKEYVPDAGVAFMHPAKLAVHEAGVSGLLSVYGDRMVTVTLVGTGDFLADVTFVASQSRQILLREFLKEPRLQLHPVSDISRNWSSKRRLKARVSLSVDAPIRLRNKEFLVKMELPPKLETLHYAGILGIALVAGLLIWLLAGRRPGPRRRAQAGEDPFASGAFEDIEMDAQAAVGPTEVEVGHPVEEPPAGKEPAPEPGEPEFESDPTEPTWGGLPPDDDAKGAFD